MALNIKKLLQDYDVTVAEDSDNRTTAGWTNTKCPFCSSNKNLLGIANNGKVHCWKCGDHTLEDTLVLLLSVNKRELRTILSEYRGEFEIHKPGTFTPNENIIPPKYMLNTLLNEHRQYLERVRGFDSERVEYYWRVHQCTNYKTEPGWSHRIMIPFYLNNRLVTYQGRTVCGHPTKYKSLSKERSIYPVGHLLYGIDNVVNDYVVVTEGVMDVWKLGYGAVATQGTSLSISQIRQLAEFDKVFIVPDKDAVDAWSSMLSQLRFFGVRAMMMADYPADDPGDLSLSDAKLYMDEIKKIACTI